MDSRDLAGALVGAGVVAATLAARDARTPAEIAECFARVFRPDFAAVASVLSEYSGVELSLLQSVPEGVVEVLHSCGSLDDLALYLNAYAGGDSSSGRFFETGASHRLFLVRCLIEQSRKLLHASVRVRMQVRAAGAVGDYWLKMARFVQVLFGGDDLGRALSVATIVDVVSDVVFFNSDLSARISDLHELERYQSVLDELRRVDFAAVAASCARDRTSSQ
jgi:hypothetical protein